MSNAATAPANRRLWDGNKSVILLGATLYMLCFIGTLGFPLVPKSVSHAIHIVGALIFALCCAWNLFHTPSHGEFYRRAHRWSGWTGMGTGALTFLSGVLIIATRQANLPPASQALFCATGVLQLFLQTLGLYKIRFSKSAAGHRKVLTIMFYCSVLLPGVNRLPEMAGFEGGLGWTLGSMPVGCVLAFFAILGQEKALARDARKQNPPPAAVAAHARGGADEERAPPGGLVEPTPGGGDGGKAVSPLE